MENSQFGGEQTCFVNSLSGPSRIEASRETCGVGVCFILACNSFFSEFVTWAGEQHNSRKRCLFANFFIFHLWAGKQWLIGYRLIGQPITEIIYWIRSSFLDSVINVVRTTSCWIYILKLSAIKQPHQTQNYYTSSTLLNADMNEKYNSINMI